MAELTPEEKQKIYQEEKERLERLSQVKPNPSANKPKKKITPTGIFAIIVFAGLAILFYVQRDKLSLLKDTVTPQSKPSSSLYTPPPAQASDHFSVKINKFSTSDGYYEVVGEIENTSSRTFQFVQLKAHFLNKSKAVVGDDTTYACAEDYILPRKKKSFKFMGVNQPDYDSVRCEVVSCSEVK